MANGHRALEFMSKIEAETGQQISDGLFDALVHLIDDAWSRGNKQGRAEGMEEAAKIASGIERKASDPSKEIWWDVALEIAEAIRANIAKLKDEDTK